MPSKRIAYIDTAKTICIFLMVVGHWTSNDVLIKYIYSFHMPALFIISGYLYKPRPWHKTFLSFGVPVAFYSLLNLCFLVATHEISVNSLLSKEVFFRFFHYRYGLGEGLYMGDWFIWALLGLRLFWGDIRFLGFLKKYYLVIATCGVLYMSAENLLLHINSVFGGWYIGLMVPSLPFFCFGFLLKEIGWSPNMVPNYGIIFFTALFLMMPILNGFCSINSQEHGLSYALFFLNALASSLLIFVISYRISDCAFSTVMSKGTLFILGIHMPLIKLLSIIIPSYLSYIIPIIVMLLCYYPIKWMDIYFPSLLGRIK